MASSTDIIFSAVPIPPGSDHNSSFSRGSSVRETSDSYIYIRLGLSVCLSLAMHGHFGGSSNLDTVFSYTPDTTSIDEIFQHVLSARSAVRAEPIFVFLFFWSGSTTSNSSLSSPVFSAAIISLPPCGVNPYSRYYVTIFRMSLRCPERFPCTRKLFLLSK